MSILAIRTSHLVGAGLAAALALGAVPSGAYQVVGLPVVQPQSLSPDGRTIATEAATIRAVDCNGARENHKKFYVYEYLNRNGFRAIRPPDWAHPVGGRDYATFQQAAAIACAQSASVARAAKVPKKSSPAKTSVPEINL
jgi:hypothetical protein